MNPDNQNFLNDIRKQVEDYIRLRIDLIKLELGERIAKILASFFSVLLLTFMLFLILFFVSLMAGFYFSRILNDDVMGFGIVIAFHVLLLLIGFIFRKPLLEIPVMNRIIKIIFSGNE